MPAPKRSERSAPDQDRKAGAGPRQWAVRRQAHRRRHRRRFRRHLPRRPREAAGGRQVQGAGRATMARVRAARRRRPHQRRALGGRVHGRDRRARWQFTLRGLDRPLGDLARRAAPQGRGRPRRGPLERDLRGRAVHSSARSRSAKGDAKDSIEYALGVLSDADAPMHEKFDVALGPGALPGDGGVPGARGRDRRSRSRSRSRSTASRPASAPGTSCSRAPGAA